MSIHLQFVSYFIDRYAFYLIFSHLKYMPKSSKVFIVTFPFSLILVVSNLDLPIPKNSFDLFNIKMKNFPEYLVRHKE